MQKVNKNRAPGHLLHAKFQGISKTLHVSAKCCNLQQNLDSTAFPVLYHMSRENNNQHNNNNNNQTQRTKPKDFINTRYSTALRRSWRLQGCVEATNQPMTVGHQTTQSYCDLPIG
jgi:hypothetical protein